jgi:hypothetical protein
VGLVTEEGVARVELEEKKKKKEKEKTLTVEKALVVAERQDQKEQSKVTSLQFPQPRQHQESFLEYVVLRS